MYKKGNEQQMLQHQQKTHKHMFALIHTHIHAHAHAHQQTIHLLFKKPFQNNEKKTK